MSSFVRVGILCGAAAVLVSIISYIFRARQPSQLQKSKKERAKKMTQAFKVTESRNRSSEEFGTIKVRWTDSCWATCQTLTRFMKSIQDRGEATMEITQLWVYPIKSIRGCSIPNATLNREGFTMDRKFMLLKDHEETPLKFENMAISKFPQMCLFYTSIKDDKLIVTYRAPAATNEKATKDDLEIPLISSTFANLKTVDINMHFSPTTGYDMGDRYNEWFSKNFGFKVILVFWGGNTRQVLGNLPGKPANQGPKPRTSMSRLICSVPFIGRLLESDDDVIAFNDCAPLLVITEKSTADVTSRLPDDVEMDITKFRANIVLKGSLIAYEEDFWGELLLGDHARILLTANCSRCVSLNVDYETGESGTGRAGGVLKLLAKDRRVDPGSKYSPIFGRYGFVSKNSEGKVLNVGDQVVVAKRLVERTKFYWPGISTN